MGEAWIVDAVRTPRGRGKADTGALSGVHPQELLAQTLNALADAGRASTPRDVEDVVVGLRHRRSGEQGACIARNAADRGRLAGRTSPASRSTASAAPGCRR